jgi:hypothetical protein
VQVGALARQTRADRSQLATRLGFADRRAPPWPWGVIAASLSGWVWLLAAAPGGFAGLCTRAGWIGRFAAEWRAGLLAPQLLGCALMALAMSVAMMLPLTMASLRYVAVRSFPWRRGRSIGAWLAAYLGLWTLAILTASLPLMAVAALARPMVAAGAFLLAAAWQLTPAKLWALQACHRIQPLHPTGVRADGSCFVYGARIAAACLVSCGPMMFAAMASPWPTLAMIGVFVVALYERYRPRPSTAAASLAFAAAGGLLALQAVL